MMVCLASTAFAEDRGKFSETNGYLRSVSASMNRYVHFQLQQVREMPNTSLQRMNDARYPQKNQATVAKISLDETNASIQKVLDKIAMQSGFSIGWSRVKVQLNGTVSVTLKDVSVREALEVVLNGTGVAAVISEEERTIVLVSVDPANAPKSQDVSSIRGRVIDSTNGNTIRGATVTVVGTKLRAITNEQGVFSLKDVPIGEQSISVRMFGYRPVARSVTVVKDKTSSIAFNLVATTTTLAGVVTTATGVQDRRAVGNDITVLNADSIMKIAPVTSVTDLLESRVPGLTVIRSSGIPGAPSRIRLRGVGGGLAGGTNTSNDPIVFVDGIRVYANQSTERDGGLAPGKRLGDVLTNASPPSALDQIDPNSIETIEVFKGASATSQWGSDAGNGVIVITTKRGRAGPARIRGSLSAGFERMPGQYAAPGYYRFGHTYTSMSSVLCADYGMDLAKQGCIVEDSTVRFQALDNPRFSPFGTGTSQAASVTLSGGVPTATYSLTASMSKSLGYLKMPAFYEDLYRSVYDARAPQWMRRPTGMEQLGINTSMVVEPRSTLRMTLNTSFGLSDASRSSGQELLGRLSGMYIDTIAVKVSPRSSGAGLGPFGERSQSRALTTNLGGAVDWMRWARLPMRGVLGLNTVARTDRREVPYGFGPNIGGEPLGFFGLGRGQSLIWSGNVGATVLQGSALPVAIGAQWNRKTTQDFSSQADTLQPGVQEPSHLNKATQATFASNTAGWYVEPKINLNSRFFAAPGFRLDGGSATRTRRGRGLLSFFPKFNFSWLAVDRDPNESIGGVLTMLRPRLGFGVAGVQPDPAWSLRLMKQGGEQPYQDDVDGVYVGSFGNPALRPERSREIEGGFDADLWGGRASFTVSSYAKWRYDAIQSIRLPASVYGGSGSYQTGYYLNIGTIRNTGAEVTVSARIIETQTLAWGVNAALSTNRNMVQSLYEGAPRIGVSDGTRVVPGYPLGGRWGRPILGYTVPPNGRLSMSDVILGDSAVFLGGAAVPAWELPVQTTISLFSGMLSLNAGFDYKHGLTQFNQGGTKLLRSVLANPNASYWEQAAALMANPQKGVIVGCIDASDGPTCGERGTFYGMVHEVQSFRFQTLSVNYEVPQRFAARMRLPRTSVALQGSNLGLWTTYRGKDPDVNSGANTSEAVIDDGAAPRPRSWMIRITLSN